MRDSWDPPPGVALCNGLSSEGPLPRLGIVAKMIALLTALIASTQGVFSRRS